MSVNTVKSDGSLLRVAGGTLYADAPIGEIHAFGGSIIPNGYLLCDGQAISRTTYAELFAVIGTAFGTGDGTTTFNVPDFRECVLVGAGQNATNTIAEHDVYTVGEFKDDQLQNITGSIDNVKGTFGVVGFNGGDTHSSGAFKGSYATGLTHAGQDGTKSIKRLDFDASLVARTGTTTHGKQRGVNYIIKARQVAVPFDVAEYIRNQNVLSEWETITLPTTAANAITMAYDGFIYAMQRFAGQDSGSMVKIYINGIEFLQEEDNSQYHYAASHVMVPVKKGDVVYVVYKDGTEIMNRGAFYKLRDYAGR